MNERIINKIDNAIDSRLPQSREAIRRRKNRILKPVAALAIAGSLVGGYKTIEHAIAMPSFSEETHTLIAEPGEGIQSIVQRGIEGIETIDYRDAISYVEALPENADTFADGMLQQGEPVVVPESTTR